MNSSLLRAQIEAALGDRIPSALTPKLRPEPELLPTGIAEVDSLAGGVPRGGLTEICGPLSSGRTTLLLSILAQATQRGECCALIDAGDAFDPHSAATAGVKLEQLLWVRASERSRRETKKNAPRGELQRLEQSLKAADLVLESGGFGLVVMDFAGLKPAAARRVPLTSWFRFRRAVENTPTALLALVPEPYARSCASLVLRVERWDARWQQENIDAASAPAHARFLKQLQIRVEVQRAALGRKPAGGVANFSAEKFHQRSG